MRLFRLLLALRAKVFVTIYQRERDAHRERMNAHTKTYSQSEKRDLEIAIGHLLCELMNRIKQGPLVMQ